MISPNPPATPAPSAPADQKPHRRWRRLRRLAEPYWLFPAFSVLIVAVIWTIMLTFLQSDRARVAHAAAASTRELAQTYEAQTVRAMHEIDKTLKLVQYAHTVTGARSALQDLRTNALLPPDLLFATAVFDRHGMLVSSTRPWTAVDVANQAYFQQARASDQLFIDRPFKDPRTGEWKLLFSRRLTDEQDAFAGVVALVVDGALFLSGYDAGKLGNTGLLGILSDDGTFLALRIGDSASAGERWAEAVALGRESDAATAEGIQRTWQGVRRYVDARRLFGYPMTVLLGISEQEYVASAAPYRRAYVNGAAAASVFLLIVGAALGRMSWQVVQSRRRAVQAQVDYAKQIEHLAYHDSLTQLPNRSLFSKLLQQNISQAKRYGRNLAVMFIDLDGFKQINDTLGHEAGDELLKEIARRLVQCVRAADVVGRLGGDEFVVLVTDVSEPKNLTLVAQKILTAVAQPVVLQSQACHVTASIGISLLPEDGSDEQTLMKAADSAMYQAKEGGKNNFQCYSAAVQADSLERRSLEAGLHRALERGEFELYYQAKRDTRTGRITGMEALLRWRHPELGVVEPMQFIQVAEDTRLIVPIGRWVLETACRQSLAWSQSGVASIGMAVNLTERQFYHDKLAADLAQVLLDTGIDPSVLELEVSEAVLMRNVGKASSILAALKQLGVRIAIDDFGVGYSSFTTLRQFPLDTIKIDRSFTRHIVTESDSKTLAEAIIAMGRSLSRTVIAQGVETGEQAEFLREHACDQLQGFYFDEPVPALQVAAMLATQRGLERGDSGERAAEHSGQPD